MTTIYVTNRWTKSIAFPYNFVMYEFPVGESVEIPIEAASHIFGYDQEDKEPYLIQLGLIKTRNDFEEALRILSRFECSFELPTKNRNLSPSVERVPLPNARRAGGNVLANA